MALVPGGSTRADDCVAVGKELAAVFLTGGVPVSAVARLLADAEPPVEHGSEGCVLEVCSSV